MQYNPQYCTIVVRNTDGSGYLRQFKTLAEAKDAYASISASESAVYLYQPPTKSLADGNPESPPPPPISSTDSQVVESGVTRSPFGFNSLQNETVTRMTKVGCSIIPATDAIGVTYNSPMVPMYRFTYTEDGVEKSYDEFGEQNTNGCYYPAGFKIESSNTDDNIYTSVRIINSLDYGGYVYGPYYEVTSLLGYGRYYKTSNGDGTTNDEEVVGVPHLPLNALKIEWEFYQNGDVPYKFTNSWDNWTRVGYPIPNGNYLVTYRVPNDERIHSGYWSASITSIEQGAKVKWVFTPQTPDQPPPPPCSILKKTVNPVSGVVEEDCDPDVVYPFTVEEDCEPPVSAQIEGQTIILGTNKKTGMNNGYGDITWGQCSGMIYVPQGTLVLSGSLSNYYSNGQGGYYSDGSSNCDPEGTLISENNEPILVQIAGNDYQVGYHYENTVADGNCGTGVETGTVYLPYGTFVTDNQDNRYYSDGAGSIYSCLISGNEISSSQLNSTVYITEISSSATVGTFTRTAYADGVCGTYNSDGEITYIISGTQIASGNGYNFFSNGQGGYYSEQIPCDSYGTFLSGNSSDLTIYISEIGSSYTAGSYNESTYADGNCGTYTETGNSWYMSGTQIASDGSYNYLSDGNGGYYSEPISNNCDAYGTYISGSNSDATIYISEIGSNYTVGSNYDSTYADGNCGTYTESGTSWYSSGTYITNGNGYNFYSNGSGGYYSESDGSGGGGSSCDSYGTYISGNGGDSSIYISELSSSYTAGSYSESIYADGNCGTYTESSTSWYSYGTQIASDGSYNYYSDGNGSYYSQSI